MSKYSYSQKNSVQIVNKLGYVFGFCCHVINNKYIFNICQSNMYLFYSFQMWQSQQVYFWLNSSTRVLVSDLLNKFLECIFSFFKLLNGIFKRFKNALQLAAKCTDINLKEQWKRQEYCFLRRRETTNYSERLNSCCKISYNCTAKLPTWSKKKKSWRTRLDSFNDCIAKFKECVELKLWHQTFQQDNDPKFETKPNNGRFQKSSEYLSVPIIS